MIHSHTSTELGDHYAVNVNGARTCVLAQLQHVYSSGHCDRVRVMLTAEEARRMAKLLMVAADHMGGAGTVACDGIAVS